jgi:hypothetical protein
MQRAWEVHRWEASLYRQLSIATWRLSSSLPLSFVAGVIVSSALAVDFILGVGTVVGSFPWGRSVKDLDWGATPYRNGPCPNRLPLIGPAARGHRSDGDHAEHGTKG